MAQPVDRRQFLIAGLASTLAGPAAAEGGAPVFIADMHAHLFFFGPRPASSQPLARSMAAGNVTLFSWSLVGDVPWLKRSRRGFEQKRHAQDRRGARLVREGPGADQGAHRAAGAEDRAHAGRRRSGAQGRPARRAVGRRRELPRQGCRPAAGCLRPRHPPRAARPLHPQSARRFPDGAAGARRHDRARQGGRAAMQSAGHAGRPRALHRARP